MYSIHFITLITISLYIVDFLIILKVATICIMNVRGENVVKDMSLEPLTDQSVIVRGPLSYFQQPLIP